SYTYGTRGTGGWLDLTRWGLPPHKKRQASLGALTLAAPVQDSISSVDVWQISVARPISAAAVGLRLVDDVKRLLERAEHVLLEESNVDVERLLAPVLPFRPGEVGEEVLDEGTLDRRPPPAALSAGQKALGTGDPRVSARLTHLRAARDV